MSYGVPTGSAINYGAPGFPDWVYQLGNAFGLRASTYPGHQENDRIEDGYARNPQRLNRGIDWRGPVDDMQRFAEYCLSIRDRLEQVIWQNPIDGRRVGVAGGRDVTSTAYYGDDYGGHQDHVHTRQSEPISLPGGPPEPADVLYRAVPIISRARAAELLPQVTEGLAMSACTNPRRVAMWLAQCGHESDGFATTEEYATGDAYDTRTDLGNTPQVDGDGRLYKGRGWIQCTGKNNYRKFSQWAHGQGLVPSPTWFVDNPLALSEMRWAAIVSAWYWTVDQPRLNEYADAGDVENASKAINAPAWIGTPRRANGIEDRTNRYTQAIALGDELLALIDGEDDDMASGWTPELVGRAMVLLENQTGVQRPSLSPFRHPYEGNVNTCGGFAWATDGNVHAGLVAYLAVEFGDPASIALLWSVQETDEPGREHDSELAARVLLRVPAEFIKQAAAPIQAWFDAETAHKANA